MVTRKLNYLTGDAIRKASYNVTLSTRQHRFYMSIQTVLKIKFYTTFPSVFGTKVVTAPRIQCCRK